MSLEDIKKKLEDNDLLTDDEVDEIIDNSTDSSWAGVKTQFLAQVNQFKIADKAAKLVVSEIQQNNPTLSEADISKIIENADGFDKILLEQGKSSPTLLPSQKSEILSLTAVAIGATAIAATFGPVYRSGVVVYAPSAAVVSQGTDEAIRAALNKSPIPPDAQPRQLKETLTDGQIKQCILLANIGTVADFYHEALAYDYDGFIHHGRAPSTGYTPKANYNYINTIKQGANLYGRSIVPLNLQNPELFMKFLTSPNNSNQYLYNMDARNKYLNQTRNFMQLCFVKNIEDGGSLRPFEFPFIDSEKQAPANYNFVLEYLKSTVTASTSDDKLYETNFETKSPRERFLTKQRAKTWWLSKGTTATSNAPKNLKSIDISFDGTNPSTARNDVKVTISFDMPNLANLTSPFTIESKQSDKSGKQKEETFRLADLVLFPSMVNNATPNTGRAFRSQYDPNHNRIRIYLNTQMLESEPNKNTFIDEENRIALDLTLVDHDLKKSGDDLTTDTTFTVTYRGYAESFLSVPLMDTLVGPDVLQERINREKILETAITEGCQLSQVRRIVADLNLAAAAEAQFGSSRIIDELHKRDRIIKVDGIDAGAYDLYTVPSSTGGFWSSTTTTQAPSINAPAQNSIVNAPSISTSNFSIQSTNDPQTSTTRTEIYYFYLADLIDICSDNLMDKKGYEKHRFRHTDSSSKYCTNTKYNFILGTVTVPIGNENDKTINLAQIPISVDFFKEWYKENIIDKKLTYFPIISMIRQLCERVITNMLINFCFADRLESDIVIRTAFVEDSNWQDDRAVSTPGRGYCKQLVEEYFYNNNNFSLTDIIPATSATNRTISSVQPLFNHNREIGLRSSNLNCDTFSNVIIYAQGKNEIYSRNFVQNAKTDRSIPIIDATDKKRSFHLKSWNFSKVQQPGLREARYFNASLNQITQLTSVYDITLNFKIPLLTLVPGQIILIVMEQQLGRPSNPDSLSFQLGLGGYHIITKVNHKFGDGNILDPRLETTINARWIASGAPQDILRSINPTVNIGDPTDLQKFNACNAVAEYARETSAAVVYAARAGTSGTTGTPTDYASDAAALFTPPSAQAEVEAFLPADAPKYADIKTTAQVVIAAKSTPTSATIASTSFVAVSYEFDGVTYAQIQDQNGKILGYVDSDDNFIDVPALLEEEPE